LVAVGTKAIGCECLLNPWTALSHANQVNFVVSSMTMILKWIAATMSSHRSISSPPTFICHIIIRIRLRFGTSSQLTFDARTDAIHPHSVFVGTPGLQHEGLLAHGIENFKTKSLTRRLLIFGDHHLSYGAQDNITDLDFFQLT
jgi:hypothetical protein